MVGDIQTGAGVTDWLGTLKTGMKENQIILEVIKKLTYLRMKCIFPIIDNEYCLCMNYHKDGSWNDCPCDRQYGGVCKKPHLPDLTGF